MSGEEIINELKKEVLKSDFDRYIKQLNFNSKLSNEDYLVFDTSNELMAKFLTTKYKEKIQSIYEKNTGIKPKIKISSKNSINQISKKLDPNKPVSTILNNSYSFENFVVGESNSFAYSSALTIAKNLGKRYNPLFIYGPTGLGKTHLLQSIGNYCIARSKSVICVTSEQFINDFLFSIKNKSMDNFKKKYRNCDLLLIDDVQFLQKAEETQNEFFHTFNELRNKEGQIVMTSDKAPKDLNGLEERLMSRFDSGLTIDIKPPGLDIKLEIIKRKAKDNKITIDKDIITYIAINMGTNMREIESALNKLVAFKTMMGINLTLDLIKDILKDQISENNESVSLDKILSIISKELNIKPSEIKGKIRTKNVVKARRIAIFLSKELTNNSMPTIAKFFNMKDHSSISHNIKKLNEILKSDDYLMVEIEELKKKILKK